MAGQEPQGRIGRQPVHGFQGRDQVLGQRARPRAIVDRVGEGGMAGRERGVQEDMDEVCFLPCGHLLEEGRASLPGIGGVTPVAVDMVDGREEALWVFAIVRGKNDCRVHDNWPAPEGREQQTENIGVLDGRRIGGRVRLAPTIQCKRDGLGAGRIRQNGNGSVEVVRVLVVVGVVVVLIQQGHAVPGPRPGLGERLGIRQGVRVEGDRLARRDMPDLGSG